MSNFTITQIHKPEEQNLIVDYPFNQIVFKTIKSNKWDVEVNVHETKDGITKIIGNIFYDEFRFDKARNIAKDFVQTDYTLQLDADEKLIYGDVDKWCELDCEGYIVNIVNTYGHQPSDIFPTCRLFKTKYDYVGYAHERPIIDKLNNTDIILLHSGYYDKSNWKEKATRNANLIIKSGLAYSDNFQREKLRQSLNLEKDF